MTTIPTQADVDSNEDFERLKAEVDALQIQFMKSNKPWYRDASTIVATLAFVFSLTTTAVSYVQAKHHDVEADRAALRQFTQRLLALPAEMVTVQRDYASQPAQADYLLSLKRQENTAIARQAAEIIERIPDQASAVECSVVTNALISTTRDSNVTKLLDLSERRAADLFERLYVMRNRGRYVMPHDPIAARREFNRALAATAGDRTLTPFERAWHDSETHMYWTEVEIDCAEARKHLAETIRLANTLGIQGPLRSRIAAQTPNPYACVAGFR
jgi:hypothetical protein